MHLLTVRQAAALLHCHPYSIYAAIYEGRLDAVKLRGNVRISADEVERALAKHEKLERALSVAEVARVLTCSESTVLRLIHARRLKAERTSGRFRITPKDLEDYVLSLPQV
jgi:excisionase family DNA binding protein